MTRPFVLLSVAVSVDGYIDDASSERLLLSNTEDFDRVDQVRADSDAILIGAATIRSDNPRLIVKSEARQAERVAAGRTATPLKVTVTASGKLDRAAKFWHYGTEHRPVVYTNDKGAKKVTEQLGDLAEVVSLGETVDFGAVLDDLGGRGIGRLMVEGGSHILTAFLSAGLADELHVAVGPALVGDPAAPRVLNPAAFPGGSTQRMRLLDVTQIGDVALLRYQPSKEKVIELDHTHWMNRAIKLATLCPVVEGAFSVGAVIVADGGEIATGYSRETDPKIHAEESALDKLAADDPRLARATIYSTLEPCSQRATKSRLPCTDRILQAGIPVVVITWREPSTFVEDCIGVEKLKENGVQVIELPELADAAMSMNRHLNLS